VFENMKRWRKNRTTIVITHDLSQIVSDDFVYVMKDGLVAEHGFRSDLMKKTPIHGQPLGVFASMAAEQAIEPLAPKIEDFHAWVDSEEMLEGEFARDNPRPSSRPHTPSFSLRPGSVMYLDILEEYARGARFSALEERPPSTRPLSRAQKTLTWAEEDLDEKLDSRRNSFASHRGSFVGTRASLYAGSRNSLVSASRNSLLVPGTPARISRLPSYDGTRSTRHSVYGRTTPARNTVYDRRKRTLSQNLEDDLKGEDDVAVGLPSEPVPVKLPGIFALLLQHLPSMPSKHLVVLGVLGSIGHGVSTPVWSAFLTRLMQAVGTGGDSPTLTENALIVLAISAAQAIAYFLQEFCLNAVASHWTAKIRGDAYASVLSQDKAWFDEPENAPSRLVQILIKDADDMRALMSQVVAKFSVFVAMVGLGIIWAMIIQWRLTLVGVAMAPAFAIIIMVNEVLIGKAERTNKAKREALAKTFYEVGQRSRAESSWWVADPRQSVANVRGIRSMALEGTFREKFLAEAIATEKTGKNAGYFLAIGTAAIAAIPLWAMGRS
jgi:ATP-binding cassette subfamily B (MDR/TAP) protein 1